MEEVFGDDLEKVMAEEEENETTRIEALRNFHMKSESFKFNFLLPQYESLLEVSGIIMRSSIIFFH